MANNDLLKEAIADAKAVKETAIANAKLALEEAFTPHLKSMLSAKLEEMDRDVEEGYSKKYEEDDVKNEEMDSKDDMKKENEDVYEGDEDHSDRIKYKNRADYNRSKDDMMEINLDELLAELELDEDKRTDAEQEGYKDGFEDAKDDIEKELKGMKVSEDARTDAEEEGYKDGMEDEKADLKEDERTDAEEEGYLDGEKDEKEDMDDEDIDLEDMSEDDLKGFIEDVIKDLVADGTIEAGDEAMEDEEDVVDMDDMDDMEDIDVEVELDEEKEYMTKKEKSEGDDRRSDDKIEAETEKMRKMEEDLKSAIDSVNELKSELNEVNLLNAKLLYTNKVFKSKNLSEDKKVRVLKAFDKASSVKEAKVIFDTLNEGLVSKPQANVRPKGVASKATGTITEAKKQPIIESNDVYNRMRKLAGLI
jgi:hypothetical protein